MGLTAFGGPALDRLHPQRAVGEKVARSGILSDGVALCQAIPGATVMQMAYTGLKLRGVRGRLLFSSDCRPSSSCRHYRLPTRTHELPAVVSVFSGLQAVIVAVVANATVSFGRTSSRTGGCLDRRCRRRAFRAHGEPGFHRSAGRPCWDVLNSGRLLPGSGHRPMEPTTLSFLIFLLVFGRIAGLLL
jgi:hypothetical protein